VSSGSIKNAKRQQLLDVGSLIKNPMPIANLQYAVEGDLLNNLPKPLIVKEGSNNRVIWNNPN
jgi:hypothetical protein